MKRALPLLALLSFAPVVHAQTPAANPRPLSLVEALEYE